MVKPSIAIVLASLSLAGCTSWAAPGGPAPFFNTGPGYFGGTHIRYESTIKPGRLYRTAEKGPLEFGSKITPLCETDFGFITVAVGADENKQDYEDKLSGKVAASASGIKWIKALFDLSAGGEVALDGKWDKVRSNDALNMSEVQGKIGAECKKLIAQRRADGFAVFFVQRAYSADTVNFTGSVKTNASLKVGDLQFVTVGPSVSSERSRALTKNFYSTVVEIVPYSGE